jgi:hypothetical protein
MFDYYDHGTTLEPTLKRVDTITQAQGQRGILEFRYKFPGQYMFHPHVSEFTELGWMGMFNVVAPEAFGQALEQAGLDPEWDHLALGQAKPWHHELVFAGFAGGWPGHTRHLDWGLRL